MIQLPQAGFIVIIIAADCSVHEINLTTGCIASQVFTTANVNSCNDVSRKAIYISNDKDKQVAESYCKEYCS